MYCTFEGPPKHEEFNKILHQSAVLYAQRFNISLNSLCFGGQTLEKCCTVCPEIQYVIEFLMYLLPHKQRRLSPFSQREYPFSPR